MNNSRSRHRPLRHIRSVFLPLDLLGFRESVMPAMRLVRYDDKIAPFGKRVVRFLELLDRREEDSVLLLLLEIALEMDSALGLNRSLPEELLAPQKLFV